MIHVKQILNNNCVLVEEEGEEKVLMGRGIGFNNTKNSTFKSEKDIEKIYTLQKHLNGKGVN